MNTTSSTTRMPAFSSRAQTRASCQRQQSDRDAAAVQRRDRQQVEQAQHDVGQHEVEQELLDDLLRARSGPSAVGMTRAASQARKKFISGPAMATIAMPRRGSRNFQAPTGTGLAQPNMKKILCGGNSNWLISRKPGRMMVPTRSICLIGLSDSRPASRAVVSPSASAA